MQKTLRILLVDDHRTMLWGLQQLVASQHPEMEVVGTATKGQEALEKTMASGPDLILLDYDLGEEKSLDIIPRLRAITDAYILVLTGIRDKKILDEVVVAGARGVIRKDEPPERLLEAIRKVTSGEIWLDREATARVFCALTQEKTKAPAEPPKFTLLTEKEKEIIDALANDGAAPNKVLARQLCISESTLRNYLTSIYQKLGVGNRTGLYMYAKTHQFGMKSERP